MRWVIKALGLSGTFLFGLAFGLSFLAPLSVERAAREVIRIEVERRMGEKIEALSNAQVIRWARKALGRTEGEIESARRDLAENVPARVAEVMADMLKADCPCRRHLVEVATHARQQQLASLEQVREHLDEFIESAYASVSAKLLREFRIFTGANAAAFALLAGIAAWRRGVSVQLLPPAIILTGAVLTTGSLYLFKQDWLHTILYSDYMGMAYLAYLGLVAAWFADMLLNRARITTQLLNLTLQGLGAAVQAGPC